MKLEVGRHYKSVKTKKERRRWVIPLHSKSNQQIFTISDFLQNAIIHFSLFFIRFHRFGATSLFFSFRWQPRPFDSPLLWSPPPGIHFKFPQSPLPPASAALRRSDRRAFEQWYRSHIVRLRLAHNWRRRRWTRRRASRR